ncbi:uncharacterized protein BDW70DRAFT_154607 [Aspergillus foveolatus]|uniref:uncharacterized protein n=1 Tax=Aspergillus foveolatus TaxID=210207 RepID=UPI003CCCB1A3
MAAPNNQEPQSASSRTTKPIEHDKPTASDMAGHYGPFLDSLRMTPQERRFLQDLLAVPQPESMDSRELDVVKRQHQDTSQAYRGPSHNESSSTSREGTQTRNRKDFHAKGASGFQLHIKGKFASHG